jgi:3-oxoacyl-(acyl-carrier-protein) synthase
MARIVITGLGIVSALGADRESFWNGLTCGESCFSPIDRFPTEPYGARWAASIREFTPFQTPKAKQPWTNDRASQFALLAARQALADAAIEIDETNRDAIGVVLGSTLACLDFVRALDRQSANPKGIDPLLFPDSAPSAPSCRISLQLGPQCFNSILSNGASSGLDAIGYASLAIQLGRAKIVLAGGVEELTRETFIYYAAMGDLADGAACRPFGRDRSGALLGEGCAILVLEEFEHARARHAPILAEVAGYGTSCWPGDGSRTARPSAEGTRAAIDSALDAASLSPKEVECIFAHANGSIAGDAVESKAIDSIYGASDAGASDAPPVVAIKSVLGEMTSASGAMAAAACALALNRAAHRLAGQTLPRPLKNGLVNTLSTTPGCGTSSSLVLRAV